MSEPGSGSWGGVSGPDENADDYVRTAADAMGQSRNRPSQIVADQQLYEQLVDQLGENRAQYWMETLLNARRAQQSVDRYQAGLPHHLSPAHTNALDAAQSDDDHSGPDRRWLAASVATGAIGVAVLVFLGAVTMPTGLFLDVIALIVAVGVIAVLLTLLATRLFLETIVRD